jgi:hypothetical protein
MKPTLLDSLDLVQTILAGDASDQRHAEITRAADDLDRVIADTEEAIKAYASWKETLALPENRVRFVRDLGAECAEREEELLANIYTGEPEYLIAAMQADVVVARVVLAIVNSVKKPANNNCLPAPYNLGEQITQAIAEYVERTA